MEKLIGKNSMKSEKNILIVFWVNVFFVFFEIAGAFITGSMAILSDSVHDLGDSITLGVSYLLEKKSKRKKDDKHTYGYVRYSLIGSIITTIILVLSSFFLILGSLKRLINPIDIHYNGMIVFSTIGIIVNLFAMYLTKGGKSLNEKAINLHKMEDLLGWIIVLIGSIIMKLTGFSLIDPILSIIVALIILIGAMKNIKIILKIFLEVTPDNIDIKELKNNIKKIRGVKGVHHIHIRSFDGYTNYLTMHVVLDKYDAQIKRNIKNKLNEMGIEHSNIEVELFGEECRDKY